MNHQINLSQIDKEKFIESVVNKLNVIEANVKIGEQNAYKKAVIRMAVDEVLDRLNCSYV